MCDHSIVLVFDCLQVEHVTSIPNGHTSLVPRPSCMPPVFDCLQYANFQAFPASSFGCLQHDSQNEEAEKTWELG